MKGYCKIILGIFLMLFAENSFSQCATPINSFPFLQDFESNDGGWVPENSIHWNWGTISGKPVISAAASGVKCWVAGSLTTNHYNSGTSTLTSPCFDISSLAHPIVGFHIFWETEKRFDGASFQYSIDNGNTWNVLGSINSNQNCQGENWFNQDPVNFVGLPGWSGNIQPTTGSCQGGNGSGEWLNAKHSLEGLGGTVIIFRFVFGAGTICNDFDGFAFDDFYIREAPPNQASFTYACAGNLSASFTPSIDGCLTAVNWDFGDPGSGTNNTSNQTSPTHQFSAGGTYTVTLTVSFSTGADIIVSQTLTVLSLSTTVLQPLLCHGDQDGSISLVISPAGNYDIVWNTSPPQTDATISGLSEGTYVASVSGTGVCPSFISVPLSAPAQLQVTVTGSNAYCGHPNGKLHAVVTGGTAPYSYDWSIGSHGSSTPGVYQGNYSVFITDQHGCTVVSTPYHIQNINRIIKVDLGRDTSICPGQHLSLYPGIFSTYEWQDGSINSHFNATQTGQYTVTVGDSLGCSGTGSINIAVDCPDIFFPNSFTPNKDNLNDGFGPWGGLSQLRDYKLFVFGRWGELIFSAVDPYQKWDGTYKSSLLPSGTYTWYSTFQLRGVATFRKGTITILR